MYYRQTERRFRSSVLLKSQTQSGATAKFPKEFAIGVRHMKKLLLATTAFLAVAANAQAADLRAKAPYLKAPVAMVYDWTGFYIGANAGVGMGRDYTRLDV